MAEAQLVIGLLVALQLYGLARARFQLAGARVVFVGQLGTLVLLLSAEVGHA